MKNELLPFYNLTPLLSLLIISCNHNFYAPTTSPTPLFREKGETQFSAHLGNGDEVENSFQLQGAYAFDSSFAFFASYYTAKGGFKDTNDDNNGKGLQFEIAIGHFEKGRKKVIREIYFGSAFGVVNNKFNPTYEVKNNFVKPFVQGNIGYRSDFFDLIFTTRIGFLHISGISERNDTGFISKEVNRIKLQPKSFLIEPGITLRIGYEPIKFQAHIGRSWNLNGNQYPQEYSILTFGVVATLNSSTKNKNIPHLNF